MCFCVSFYLDMIYDIESLRKQVGANSNRHIDCGFRFNGSPRI